jgi:hypothetical protein
LKRTLMSAAQNPAVPWLLAAAVPATAGWMELQVSYSRQVELSCEVGLDKMTSDQIREDKIRWTPIPGARSSSLLRAHSCNACCISI